MRITEVAKRTREEFKRWMEVGAARVEQRNALLAFGGKDGRDVNEDQIQRVLEAELSLVRLQPDRYSEEERELILIACNKYDQGSIAARINWFGIRTQELQKVANIYYQNYMTENKKDLDVLKNIQRQVNACNTAIVIMLPN